MSNVRRAEYIMSSLMTNNARYVRPLLVPNRNGTSSLQMNSADRVSFRIAKHSMHGIKNSILGVKRIGSTRPKTSTGRVRQRRGCIAVRAFRVPVNHPPLAFAGQLEQ
jgi:hypothetical protein